jgi:preprotein translocase subunit SecY
MVYNPFTNQTKTLKKRNKALERSLFTLFSIFLFRLGNTLPLSGIDQQDLKKSLLLAENRNAFTQVLSMYSNGGSTLLSPFSLGIIPYINASIIIDILTVLIPYFEKLQSEEGSLGKNKLLLYKKLLSILLAIFQAYFLIRYLKNYLYDTRLFTFFFLILQLVAGTIIVIWITTSIDKQGLGNGTSILIVSNIITSLFAKLVNFSKIINPFELFFLLFICLLICIYQSTKVKVGIISARQLAFFQDSENREFLKKYKDLNKINDSSLLIKLNQAGIFPIIAVTNVIGFFPFLLASSNTIFYNIVYCFLIIVFNYFYTIIFWDPEKISNELRKASVSIMQVPPGEKSIIFLNKLVRSTSIIGGIFLCAIFLLYEAIKQIFKSSILNYLNISSLIILVGVTYEIQKSARSLAKMTIKD